MALVNLVNLVVLDNPSICLNPFKFEITFECLQELDDDLEWKVIYVGSAEDTRHDQTLEEVLVGPVPVGINKFILESEPPDFSSIPSKDIIGVTVVLVTCLYKEQEFIRVGYYVNNEYTEEYDPEVGPPMPLDKQKVQRRILADKPRVTRFPIQWNKPTNPDNKEDEEEPIILQEAEREIVHEEEVEQEIDEEEHEEQDGGRAPEEGEAMEEEGVVDEEVVEDEDEEEEEDDDEDENAEIDLGDDEETFQKEHKKLHKTATSTEPSQEDNKEK